MSEVHLQYQCFDRDGDSIHGSGAVGTQLLPEFLDWRDIAAKALYLVHMGGFPPETCFMVIISQGQSKILFGLEGRFTPQTFEERKELRDGGQEWLERECREKGISLHGTPRNQ